MISGSLSTSRKRAKLHAVAGPLAEFCQALYPMLVVHADDFGRMQGDTFTVKYSIEPTSPRPEGDFNAALDLLHDVGLIARYTVNGAIYLEIINFDEHQTGLHKRTKSKFPKFPGNSWKVREIPGQEKRREEKRTKDLNQDQDHPLRANSHATNGNGHKPKPLHLDRNPKALHLIAKEVLLKHPKEEFSELCALLKERAAKARILYDADGIRAALDQAAAVSQKAAR